MVLCLWLCHHPRLYDLYNAWYSNYCDLTPFMMNLNDEMFFNRQAVLAKRHYSKRCCGNTQIYLLQNCCRMADQIIKMIFEKPS